MPAPSSKSIFNKVRPRFFFTSLISIGTGIVNGWFLEDNSYHYSYLFTSNGKVYEP
jgi:hypothetical protein